MVVQLLMRRPLKKNGKIQFPQLPVGVGDGDGVGVVTGEGVGLLVVEVVTEVVLLVVEVGAGDVVEVPEY